MLSALAYPILEGRCILVAASFCCTLSMALSNARPIKNSRERSRINQRIGYVGMTWCRTVDTLLVRKRLILLRLVPVDDQTVSERKRSASIRSSTCSISSVEHHCIDLSYASSQLYKDRARVVSMWPTACFCTKLACDLREASNEAYLELLRRSERFRSLFESQFGHCGLRSDRGSDIFLPPGRHCQWQFNLHSFRMTPDRLTLPSEALECWPLHS